MVKVTNKKNRWLNIWEQKGYKLRSSDIDNIIRANGHNSKFSQFNKHSWYKYIKSLFRRIKINKNYEILEYGCGAGAFLSYWYKKKYRLNGIDYSKTLIKKAKKYFPKINFVVGEISSIDHFETKFDLIFSHSVFQYFENRVYAKNLLLKMLKNLKLNGNICILDVPNAEKEKLFIKKLKKEIGISEFKKKYEKNKHIFYKKSFFKEFAKKNKLKILIFDHYPIYSENSKYRYNVIFKS